MGGPQGAEAITPVPLQGQLALCLHSPHAYSNDELDLFISVQKESQEGLLFSSLYFHVIFEGMGCFL